MKNRLSLFLILAFIFFLTSCAAASTKESAKLMLEPIKLSKKEIKSKYLKTTPTVEVYLPASYENTDKKYSVLYMHDGQNLKAWKLIDNINALLQAGLIQEIIVVGVYNTPNRISDYTPTKISNQWVKNQGGNLSNYAKFLVEELKPYIDSHYRTLTNSKDTAIMGSSLGGLASLYLAGWYSDIFGMSGVVSPSFWWDDVRITNDLRKISFPKKIKLYIDGGYREWGDEELMIPLMRMVKHQLNQMGLKDEVNIYYYEDPNGSHNEDSWSKRVKMPLVYFFGQPNFTPLSTTLMLFPQRIGVGDQSKVVPIFSLPQGLKLTPLPGKFTLNKPNLATIDQQGNLIGKAGGQLTVTFEKNGVTASKTFSILPRSRDLAEVTFTIISPTSVEGMSLQLKVHNEKKTNATVQLKMVDFNVGKASIILNLGDRLKYQIIDSSGKIAYDSNGNPLIKKTLFSADREVKIKVAEWK